MCSKWSGWKRLNQDLQFQARIVCQDMQLPLQRILECCRQLEEQSRQDADPHQAQAWIDDAHRTVAAVQNRISHLETIASHWPASPWTTFSQDDS